MLAVQKFEDERKNLLQVYDIKNTNLSTGYKSIVMSSLYLVLTTYINLYFLRTLH